MAQITYNNKVALNTNPNVAEINKVTDNNMNEIKNAVNTNTPVGSISLFAGTTAPSGWLICDGSAVSRTTYANLFSVIGTTYGTGDGSTTFNIPNLKGKVPVGYDSSDTNFDTIGETGGEKTHTLSVDEMPSHRHLGLAWVGDFNTQAISLNSGSAAGYHLSYGGDTVADQKNNIYTNYAGGGQAHNNLQPYIVMNYIISY